MKTFLRVCDLGLSTHIHNIDLIIRLMHQNSPDKYSAYVYMWSTFTSSWFYDTFLSLHEVDHGLFYFYE